MKIVVCIKQVVTRDWQVRLDEARTWIRDADADFEMNEPDAYALEEALRLREKHGGEVVAVLGGPGPRHAGAARGAGPRRRSRDPRRPTMHWRSADAFVVAEALAAAIGPEAADLVLTGLQSDDMGFGQTGVILAERLGVPHATIIMDVQVEGAGLRVKRELEGGWFQWIEMPLPALLTIQSGINQLRYATLKGIMARQEEGDPRRDASGRPGRAAGRRSPRARTSRSRRG